MHDELKKAMKPLPEQRGIDPTILLCCELRGWAQKVCFQLTNFIGLQVKISAVRPRELFQQGHMGADIN